MRTFIDELSDEELQLGNVKASRILGPARNMQKASPSGCNVVNIVKPKTNEKAQVLPDLDSFAFRKDEKASSVVKRHGLSTGSSDHGGQRRCRLFKSSSYSPSSTPIDISEEVEEPPVPSKEQEIDLLDEEDELPFRRRRNVSIRPKLQDEKEEEEEEPRIKKPRRLLKVLDAGSDDEFEPTLPNQNIVIVEDDANDAADGSAVEEPEAVLIETLGKCDQIAASLKQELKLDSAGVDTYQEVNVSAVKLIKQSDVCAACGISASSDQVLKPYQLVGVNFLLLLHRKNVGGAILADEMGLGKTVQALAFLALLQHLEGDPGPHLIVCPASVLENWQRELQKWCPSFNAVLFHGANRMSAKEDLQYAAKAHQPAPFHVLLTSYSLFERRSASSKEDRSMLRKWNWSCVVMDEAHLLKDRNSLRTKHLRLIAQNARHRLMITGTPLQNDLQELWSLLEFTMPNIFKNCNFDELVENKNKMNGRAAVTAQDMDLIEHIKAILGPFVLRRVKADVMHQLLPKTHKVESLEMVPVQDAAYKKAVNEYRALAAASAKSSANANFSFPRRQISSIFTHLRKLANHPLLVRRVYTDRDVEKLAKECHRQGIFGDGCTLERVREELNSSSDYTLYKLCSDYSSLAGHRKLTSNDVLQSAKCQVLRKLLPELHRKGHRPLIFSQWTGMLDILEWALDVMDVTYTRLDGSTQVAERQTIVDTFNNDKDIFAFLLSTRAGGQGLNLVGADTVIIHDVDFNPQMDRQAEDRCHRIGQSRPVTVYRLFTRATVDENIFNIAQRKLVLDAVLESSAPDVTNTDNESDTRTMGQILSAILGTS